MSLSIHSRTFGASLCRMEGRKSIANVDDEMREMLAEFIVGVIKFEELVELGSKFLMRFQQALELLRRSSIYESSDLVKSIIKANETKRINAYVEAGCINAYDIMLSVDQLNTSLSELLDCVSKAKAIINELENLMEKAGNALCVNSNEQLEMEYQGSEKVIASEKPDAVSCASFMTVIYNMVKQDYVMQEKIVFSLNFKSSSGELESYLLMWSLRPFINDDVIHQALRQVR